MESAIEEAGRCRDVAESLNAGTVGVVFFSGHIESDAFERDRKSTAKVRSEMVGREIAALMDRMGALGQSRKTAVHVAAYRRRDFEIGEEWKAPLWPAAFGMCAVIECPGGRA